MKFAYEYLDWDTARIIAERDGHVVEKTARLSDCVLACSRSPEEQQIYFAIEITKKLREADRDLAFKLHGMEFRKHCHFNTNFWGPMSQSEKQSVGIDL